MKVKEEVEKEETNLPEESLTDLELAADQADETTGGTSAKLFLHCASGVHI